MKTYIGLLSILSLGLLTGCVNTYKEIEPCETFSVAQVINEPRVVTEPSFDRACHIVRMGQEMTSSDTWQYKLLLGNKTTVPQNAYYFMLWYDAEGKLIELPTPVWLTTLVLPGEYKEVRIPSPTKEARDFRLYLRGRYDADAKDMFDEANEDE